MPTQFTNGSHGVLHTPSSVLADSTTLTIQNLKEAGIKYVRVQWVEPTNIVRLRVIPLSHFERVMQSARPGFGIPKSTPGLVYLMVAEGYGAAGEYFYVPDLSTMRICPYAPGHASVLGWFEEKDPYPGLGGKLTVRSAICPRTSLRDVVGDAKGGGVEFLVGLETEFILLESTNPVRTGNVHQYSGAEGLLTGLVETQVLEEIVDALIQSGIQVEAYHPEAAPGQYEISTGPLAPLEAADAVIHTRQTIINIAAKHGLCATLAPRITMTSAGSASHAHISVHKAGHRKPEEKLSDLESSFLAGVLDDLPALAGFTLPIPASYKRVADGVWSGGTYVAWGTENRECPIRLSNARSPGSRNFEMRFIDGTANPYLVLASILGLGYAGIKSKKQLHLQDFSGLAGPAQLSEERRQALGITRRMPLSWEEGRDALTRSEALNNIFGNEFMEKYLAANKVLGKALSLDDDDEQKALTRLVEFY